MSRPAVKRQGGMFSASHCVEEANWKGRMLCESSCRTFWKIQNWRREKDQWSGGESEELEIFRTVSLLGVVPSW